MERESDVVRFDWAIKRLLRQKANFVILEGFLSELLKEDITINEILESETKQIIVLVKNSKDELMIIDIQNTLDVNYCFLQERYKRYGTCRPTAEIFEHLDGYPFLKKVCAINILYFDICYFKLGNDSDYIYHGTTTFKGLHNEAELSLSENQQRLLLSAYPSRLYVEYYLINVNQFNNIVKDTLDEWIYYLRNTDILSHFTAQGLPEAIQALDEFRQERQERKNYDRFIDDLRFNESILDTARLGRS